MREAGWKDRIMFTLGRLKAVRVSGDSMRPTLENGDVVFIRRTNRISVGDIVLAGHPFRSSVSVLKRVVAVDDSGRFDLRGDDSSASSDSRSFGSIPLEHIRGKAVSRLKRGGVS